MRWGLRQRAYACVLGIAVAGATPVLVTQARSATKPSASDLARAEELYDNGRTLFAEGSYAAAATAFEEAHGLSGNLDMLYNAALAHDRAGDFGAAIELLDRYRAMAPASERAGLDERKKSLQVRLDKQREDAAKAAANPEPVAALTDATPADTIESRPERRVRTRTWALLGGTAAGLAIGTGLGAASLVRTRAARGGCTDLADALLCEDDVADPARSSRPLAIGADVTFAIAGALGVAFIALLAIDLRRKDTTARAAVRVHPTAGGLAVEF